MRYRVLCADPPWRFNDKLPGKTRGASRQYETLTVYQLKHFPLPALADDAYLFLWRVAAMQQEALDVMDAWGFTLKSEIVWQKLTKTGKPWFGMGRHVRASHEVALIGVRGKPKRKVANIRSTFQAMAPFDSAGKYIHSAKPETFYRLVEQLAPGPYVELFARHQRPGWTCFGNQSGG